jgi:hypothetical protein
MTWTIDRDQLYQGRFRIIEAQGARNLIALVNPTFTGATDAHARLMVSAPRMRDLLLDLVEFWEAGSPVHPGSDVAIEVCALLKELGVYP